MKRAIASVLAMIMCFPILGCGKVEPKCEHQFGDWLVKSKSTCFKEGREERICMVCYYSESRAIPTIAHTLGDFNVCKKCSFVAFDPEAEVAELGILSYKNYGPESLANSAWDIKVWDGQVFRGAGDYDKNAGLAPILAFDIESGRWKSYGNMSDQAIHSFEEINGTLYAPGIDPVGSWDMGNFYYLKDGKWKMKRNLPNGVHNFDLIEFDGKIFAGVGTEDRNNTVAVSTDGGENFEFVPLYKDGEPFDTIEYKWSRTYEFTRYNGQLYALISFQMNIGSAYMIFRYEDGKMVWVSDQVHPLVGGISVGRKHWNGEFEFDGACYLTAGALYAIRDFSKQENYEKIEMPGGERVADAFLKDGVIYVLAFKQDTKTREYTITIYKSTTGKTGSFTPVTSFTYSVPPISFDYDGNHFYVGMGLYTNAPEKGGMVLRVNPNA